MSKPKSKFRGVPYIARFTKWDDARKGDCDYKDNINIEHHHSFRKTWHIERDAIPWILGGKCDKHIPNAKRRPSVQKHLNKLTKYVKRAWKGYSFGRLPKKVDK